MRSKSVDFEKNKNKDKLKIYKHAIGLRNSLNLFYFKRESATNSLGFSELHSTSNQLKNLTLKQ